MVLAVEKLTDFDFILVLLVLLVDLVGLEKSAGKTVSTSSYLIFVFWIRF